MIKRSVLVVLILAYSIGCTNRADKMSKDSLILNYKSDLLNITEQINKNTQQVFKLITNKSNLIHCKNGTIVFIPKNSFHKEEISCKIVEIYNCSDIVKYNLSTVNGNSLLESDGMVSIEFYDENGYRIDNIDSNYINVMMPTKKLKEGMQLYFNEYSQNNNTWNIAKGEANRIDFKSKPMWNIEDDSGYLKQFFSNVDTIGISNKLKYTFIYTWQFMHSFRSQVNTDPININEPKKYVECALKGMNLWEADSIALMANVSRFRRISAKDYSLSEIINQPDWGNHIMKPLYDLYKEGWTKPIIIDTLGIKLNEKDSRIRLKEKGLTNDQIDRLVYLNDLRKSFIQNQRKGLNFYNTVVLKHFGLINIDRLFNEKNTITSDIEISILNYESKIYTEAFLVIGSMKTVVKGTLKNNGKFSFLKDYEPYNKLPIGEELCIVVIGYDNGKISFAMRKVNPSSKIRLGLYTKPVSIIEFENHLDNLNYFNNGKS